MVIVDQESPTLTGIIVGQSQTIKVIGLIHVYVSLFRPICRVSTVSSLSIAHVIHYD